MTITKPELIDGIRFAAQRAAAATAYVDDWDYRLSCGWTTRESFAHLADWAGDIAEVHRMVRGETNWPADLSDFNERRFQPYLGCEPAEIARVIREGGEKDVAYIKALSASELDRPLSYGPYELPLAELLSMETIDHALHHAYDAVLRPPLK